MSRFFDSLRRMFGGGAGDPPPFLSPAEFTRECAAALSRAKAEIQIVEVAPLELRLTGEDGRESTSYLNNAYDIYRQTPEAKATLVQQFVAAWLETLGGGIREHIDRDRVVPVIKDRAWLEEMRRTLIDRGDAGAPEFVFDEFDATGRLVVVYAEDSPRNMRFLRPDNLGPAGIERSDLRRLACENLKRLLPNIERHGADGLYMLTAGGDYEASLLALDSIWNGGQMEVRGEIVVAVPTRDVLLVTGSDDRENLDKLMSAAKETFSTGSYRLTDALFVYRNGRFEEFHIREQRDFSLN